jgi:hypothetical protein
MSHRNRNDDHHGHHHHHHHDRLQHGLRRRLRRAGDDVTSLEQLQRDLEQATADVAARIDELRSKQDADA